MNALTISAHVPVHTLAVRIVPLGAHKPMTITQHPISHPLVGPSTVIIEVIGRACAVSSASTHERRRWKTRRYTFQLAAD